jgi:hypothetical protein
VCRRSRKCCRTVLSVDSPIATLNASQPASMLLARRFVAKRCPVRLIAKDALVRGNSGQFRQGRVRPSKLGQCDSLVERSLCVPKILSELMPRWNRLTWPNDRAGSRRQAEKSGSPTRTPASEPGAFRFVRGSPMSQLGQSRPCRDDRFWRKGDVGRTAGASRCHTRTSKAGSSHWTLPTFSLKWRQ